VDSVEQGERVERDLDAFIEKRDTERCKTEGERKREELWQESVRSFYARREQDHRLAWFEYEMRLYRIHSGLASEHLARAERLENGHHQSSSSLESFKTQIEALEERNGHQD